MKKLFGKIRFLFFKLELGRESAAREADTLRMALADMCRRIEAFAGQLESWGYSVSAEEVRGKLLRGRGNTTGFVRTEGELKVMSKGISRLYAENCRLVEENRVLKAQLERMNRDYAIFEELAPPDMPRKAFAEICFQAWEDKYKPCERNDCIVVLSKPSE